MTIKELSVGNWVKFPHGIDKINDLCRWANSAAPVANRPVSVEELEPIPITPEILEKNGIKKEYNILYDNFYYNEDISVTKAVDEWLIRIDATNCFYAKYLHQLQNALTLCGINKNIEL